MAKVNFLIIFILFHSVAIGQVRSKIEGKILDNKGVPVDNVIIEFDLDNDKKSFVQSDVEGYFIINNKDLRERTSVSFKKLNYTKKDTILTLNSSNIITLNQSVFILKEVKVKPPKIRMNSDTISYNVSEFEILHDNTIGDVLKKIPGVEVTDNGAISYQGKPINNLYIEGLNLMDSRYGLVTNTLSNKKVSEIQILENHQPIKVLDSLVFSDRAAINLRLKDDVKGNWNGEIEKHLGISPLLWNSSDYLLKVKKKHQTFNTIKLNNIGNTLISASQKLTIKDISRRNNDLLIPHEIIKLDYISIPLKASRYINNRSYGGNINILKYLSSDLTLRTNINANYDSKKNQQNYNSFFFMDNTLDIVGSNRYEHNEFQFSGDISLESNTNNNFFSNTLTLQYSDNHISTEDDNNINLNINQNSYSTPILVENTFNIINKNRKGISEV